MSLSALGTPEKTGETLARLIASGRCILEHLDLEPPTWPPEEPYRNLAREWIDAHPDEWAAMQAQHQTVVGSNP
jgi:hypothetical protein